MSSHRFAWWSQSEDLQPATSRWQRFWVTDEKCEWRLETRSENYGVGTARLGELVFAGKLTGTLTLRIESE